MARLEAPTWVMLHLPGTSHNLQNWGMIQLFKTAHCVPQNVVIPNFKYQKLLISYNRFCQWISIMTMNIQQWIQQYSTMNNFVAIILFTVALLEGGKTIRTTLAWKRMEVTALGSLQTFGSAMEVGFLGEQGCGSARCWRGKVLLLSFYDCFVQNIASRTISLPIREDCGLGIRQWEVSAEVPFYNGKFHLNYALNYLN